MFSNPTTVIAIFGVLFGAGFLATGLAAASLALHVLGRLVGPFRGNSLGSDPTQTAV